MKRLLLFFAAAFLLPSLSSAQTWCAPGATWQYYIRGSFPTDGPFGKHQINFTNTVVIGGKTCDRMLGVVQGTAFGGGAWSEPQHIVFYLTNENGVLLYSTGQTFDTIADVNASPGEGWYDDWDTDTSFSKRTVFDTGYVMVGSQNRKALFFDAMHTMAFIEGIGYNFGFFIPYKWYQAGTFDLYNFHGNFKCYKDSQLGTYKLEASWTCTDTDIGLKEQSIGALSLYPNPSGGICTVEVVEPCELSVYCLSGRVVSQKLLQTGSHTINLSHLDRGLYFLSFQTGSKQTTRRLIVQ